MRLPSFLAAFLLLMGCAQAAPPNASLTPAQAASTVSTALTASGIAVSGDMDAPQGYFGFVGNYQGRQLPVYLLPDGKHLVIGTLLDTQGNDLTSQAMRKAAESRYTEEDWQTLAKADWIAEGNPKAQRIVYVFVDTRCPYCHQFWKLYQPLLADGSVQVRNIVAAVISPSSLPEAALLYDAANPSVAWAKVEGNFGHNPTPDATAGSAASRARVMVNNALMQKLGFFGTPAVVYKGADSKIHAVNGVPQGEQALREVFGLDPS